MEEWLSPAEGARFESERLARVRGFESLFLRLCQLSVNGLHAAFVPQKKGFDSLTWLHMEGWLSGRKRLS